MTDDNAAENGAEVWYEANVNEILLEPAKSDDLPRATLERLLRVVPTLEALLAAARDREKVNNRLIESRHRLEQFFDLTSDLMVISDQGKLLEVNPAFEKALGYTVGDLAPAP